MDDKTTNSAQLGNEIENAAKNLIHLGPKDKRCKKPADFKLIRSHETLNYTYQGKIVRKIKDGVLIERDPRNRYDFIDVDGDGVCEVRSETCNEETAVNPQRGVCGDNGWWASFKWNGKHWVLMETIQASSPISQDSIDFFYFDKATRDLRFRVAISFLSVPRTSVVYIPPRDGSRKEASIDLLEHDDLYRNKGLAIPLLAVHIRRVLDEIDWRMANCGGKQGYRDGDTFNLDMEGLRNAFGFFVPDDDQKPPADVPIEYVELVHEWTRVAKGSSAMIDSQAHIRKCAAVGGYRDIERYSFDLGGSEQ